MSKPADVIRWSEREMLEVASCAIGKVLRDDVRGMTLLSIDEIAAMTGTLIGFGLIATPPGETPAKDLIMILQGERA